MKICVGKPESKSGKVLKVPCLVTVNVSAQSLSKLEPITKDLCMQYIRFQKLASFMLLLTDKI